MLRGFIEGLLSSKFASSSKAVFLGPFGRWSMEPVSDVQGNQATVMKVEKNKVKAEMGSDDFRLFALLRSEVVTLSKLKHPRLLAVKHAMHDDGKQLLFATEPLTCTLQIFLEERGGLASVEAREGLLGIVEALQFLHSSAGLVHCNLTSTAIFIRPDNSWVLGGLAHTGEKNSCLSYVPCLPRALFSLNPPTSILPPECYSGRDITREHAMDCYALGILIFELLNCRVIEGTISSPPSADPTLLDLAKRLTCENQFARMKDLSDVANWLKMPEIDTLHELENSKMLQSHEIRALMTKLLGYLPPQSHSMNHDAFLRTRVIPPLLECMASVTPSILDAVLEPLDAILDHIQIPQEYFQTTLWPRLVPLFTASRIDAPAIKILVQKVPFFVKFLNEKEKHEHIQSFVFKCLNVPEEAVLVATLHNIPPAFHHLDEDFLQGCILPTALNVIGSHSSTAAKTEAVHCLATLCQVFSKQTLCQKVLPALTKFASVPEQSVDVLMAIATATHSITLAPQESAAYIVPILSTICSHEILSNAQFKQVWSSMITAGRKVEKWKLGGTDLIGRGCIDNDTGRKDSITDLRLQPLKETVENPKALTYFAPLKDNEAALEANLTPVADNGILSLSRMFSSQTPPDVFKNESRGMMAFDDIMRLPACVDRSKAATPSKDPFADLF